MMTRYTAPDLRAIMSETPENRLVDSIQPDLVAAATANINTYSVSFSAGQYDVAALTTILTNLGLSVTTNTINSLGSSIIQTQISW